MPPFSILLIYIPGLLFKDFNCHFSICFHPLSGSFTVKHHLFLCILFHFSSIRRLPPPCLISAFILITYSVFPFHLYSYSSAVTVIYLLFVLLRDCPKSVRIPFNHNALYVLMHCSDFLALSGCLQRLHAQREAQVPQISSERARHCFSWPTWTAWSKGNIKKNTANNTLFSCNHRLSVFSCFWFKPGQNFVFVTKTSWVLCKSRGKYPLIHLICDLIAGVYRLNLYFQVVWNTTWSLYFKSWSILLSWLIIRQDVIMICVELQICPVSSEASKTLSWRTHSAQDFKKWSLQSNGSFHSSSHNLKTCQIKGAATWWIIKSCLKYYNITCLVAFCCCSGCLLLFKLTKTH